MSWRSGRRILQALVFLLLCPAASRAEYFDIASFRADITVSRDSSFVVREAIEVAFTAPRHGIYRDIPFRYTSDLGRRIKTPVSVLEVTDGSDRRRKFQVSRSGDFLRIRIGDEDKFVEGTQLYVIIYRVQNAILFLQDHDELYWNVTGNGWQAPIAQVRAVVSLKEGDGDLGLKGACWTGAFGSKESACSFAPGEAGGEFTAGGLGPGEGLTIALGWKKGIVRPPSFLRMLLWAVNPVENGVFLVPVAVFLFMLRLWRKKGRDPRLGRALAVMYTPPEENRQWLLPAEIGALIDEKLDPRDITASIVQLAVKGYISIEEVKGKVLIFNTTDYRLKKIRDDVAVLPPFEQQLLKDIFGAGGEVLITELQNHFYTKLSGLKAAVYSSLMEKGYYTSNPQKVKAGYVSAGFVVMVFGVFFGVAMAGWSGTSPAKNIVASVLSGLAVLAFAPFMPARTRKGAETFLRIKGFEEFLNKAEKDRLERMADKNLFEKYLPYAIALDVSKRWAAAFEGIYQDPPKWYISPGGLGTFHPVSFNSSLGSALSTMGAAMYSSPRSSSSGGFGGGGGSSGGGFGGGGGGSW